MGRDDHWHSYRKYLIWWDLKCHKLNRRNLIWRPACIEYLKIYAGTERVVKDSAIYECRLERRM